MTHDEHLVPARTGRDLDATLADLTQSKPYANKYSRYGSAPVDTNIKQYLFIILKRKWLILSLVLVISSLATIQAYRDPSVYEGVTMVRIEGRSPGVLSTGTGSVLVASQPDPNFWGTQLRLLRNPSLARQVALTLDLPHNPKFINGQAQSSVFNSIKRIFSGDRPAPSGPSTANILEPITEAEMNARQFTPEELAALEPYEDAIANGLQVDAIEKTNLVNIHFTHTDPEMAQKIANTLADVFVKNNMEAITAGSSSAEMQLSQQIAKYQEKIRGEQTARFEFARDHNVPIDDKPGTDLEGMRLATYSSQLLEAENNTRTQTAIYNAAGNTPDALSAPQVQSRKRLQK